MSKHANCDSSYNLKEHHNSQEATSCQKHFMHSKLIGETSIARVWMPPRFVFCHRTQVVVARLAINSKIPQFRTALLLSCHHPFAHETQIELMHFVKKNEKGSRREGSIC